MLVMGIEGVEKAIRRFPEAALITINARGQKATETHVVDRLDLAFADRELPYPGMAVATAEHVEQVMVFAEQIGVGREIIIHCHAGQSRSSSVALAVAAVWHGLGRREVVTDQDLRQVLEVPVAAAARARELGLRQDSTLRPNPWVTALLDQKLVLEGRLLRAMYDHYPNWEDYFGYLSEGAREKTITIQLEMVRAPDAAARDEIARKHGIVW